MNVKIIAKALLYDKSAEAGLTGQVFKEEEEKAPRFISSISIPIVDYAFGNFNQIPFLKKLSDANEGNYFVQLMLPDGDIITKNFIVNPGETTEVIVDIPHAGPHEWTALHALKGDIKHRVSGERKTVAFALKGFGNRIDKKEFSFTILKIGSDTEQSILQGPDTIPALSRLISENADVELATQRLGSSLDIICPTQEDNEYAIYKFIHSGVMKHFLENPENMYFDFRNDYFPRQYLIQQSTTGGVLTCLPVPWTTVRGQYGEMEQVSIDLLVDKTAGLTTPEISMTVGDPAMNTILGYINAGAVHQASKLINFNKAQQLLYMKISCPFAAAVGGYLLVFGTDRKKYMSESDRWKEWVRNLYRWFPWLPDGAILYAALHFMLGELDRDEAYTSLMQAYDRGLPFFTFGLKLLMDGMRFFVREKDEKARECLSNLETIANRTDPSQPFLTVSYSNHR